MRSHYPELDYERLAMKAFNCDRARDKWGYANADIAAKIFIPGGNLFKAKDIITKIIDAIIVNNSNNTVKTSLEKIRLDVVKMEDANNSMDYIYKIIDVLENKH